MTENISMRARPVQEFSAKDTNFSGRVGRGEVNDGSRVHVVRQTLDFPLGDGWSGHKGAVIERRRERGDFVGRNGGEAGVGDGRNPLRAGIQPESQEHRGVSFTGIDVDAWRAAVAHANLSEVGVPQDKLTILVGGAVNDLLARGANEKHEGYVFACLPQAPMGETLNHADGIDPTRDNLEGGRHLDIGPHSVDEYGLTLNAAYFRALRDQVTGNTDVQATISGRIPQGVVGELFAATGWDVKEMYRTREPVMQDIDTGVAYVDKYREDLSSELSEGFFEKTPEGLYIPIDPEEAEQRRQVAYDNSDKHVNVYHHVSEWVAIPADAENGSRKASPVTVYEI